MAPQVLLIDDDQTSRSGIAGYLRDITNIGVQVFSTGDAALAHLQEQRATYTAVLLDYVLDPAMTGEQVLAQIRHLHPDLPVIVFTGRDPKGGMQALGEGAYASLRRPLDYTELAFIIQSLADQHAVFPQIVRDLRALTGADLCLAWRLDRLTNRFLMDAWTGDLVAPLNRTIGLDAAEVEPFFADSKPRFFPNITSTSAALLPSQQAVAAAHHHYALIALPLFHRQRLVGFLDCYAPKLAPGFATGAPEMLRLLNVLGKRCAEAIHNAALSQRLQALQELNQVLADTLDEETILQQILQKALALVGCAIGWLYLFDVDTNKLTLRTWAGVDQALLDQEREADQGITGAAAKHSRSYITNDVDATTLYRALPGITVRSEIAVPLRRSEQMVGVLTIKSPFRNHFADDDLTLLTTLAAQATTAIGRARLVNALGEMSRLAVSAETFEPLAQYVVRTVRRLTGATAALWMMSKRPGEGDKVMRIVFAEGALSPAYLANGHLPNDPARSINAYALDHARPIVRANIQAEATQETDGAPPFLYLDEAQRQNWHAFMAAPLIGSGQARLGVLSLYSPFIGAFSQAECELVMAFATQAAAALQQQQRRLTLQQLAAIGQELTSRITGDPLQLLDRVAEAARTLLKADYAGIYPYDAVKERFYQTEHIVALGTHQPFPENANRARARGLAAIIQQAGRLVVHDITSDAVEFEEKALTALGHTRESALALMPTARLIEREHVQAFVGISLRTPRLRTVSPQSTQEDAVELGVLYIDFRAAHYFTAEELQLVELYATYAANIIHSARIYREMKHQRKAQIEAVREMTHSMAAPGRLTPILQGILAWTLSLMYEANVGVIRLLNPTTGRLEVLALAPPSAPVSAAELTERSATLDEWLMQSDQTQRFDDLAQAPRYQPISREARSALVAPIRQHNVIIGLLNFEHSRLQAFDEDDQQWADAVAGLVGIAIENQRLFTQLGDQVDRLHRLQAVNTQILAATTATDLEHLLHLILANLSNIFPNASCLIRLYEPTTQRFSTVVKHGNIPRSEAQREPRSEGISRHVLQTRQPYYVPNTDVAPAGDLPDVRAEIKAEGIRAMACLPLISTEQIIGLLYVKLPLPHTFSEDDKRFLELFASQAAVAIHNAQLYRQIEQSRTAQINTIREIANAILLNAAAGKQEILQQIVDFMAPLLGQTALLVTIRLLDQKTNELVLAATHAQGPLAKRTLTKRIPVQLGIAGWVVQHKQFQYVSDIQTDERYLAGLENARTELAVPLVRNDAAIGVLVVEHTDVDAFSQYTIALTQAIARLTVVALANAELYNDLRERSTQLRALYDAGLNVSANVNNRLDVLRTVVQSICELLEADVATLFVYDAQKNQFDDGVPYGRSAEQITKPSGDGNSMRLVRTRQPVFKSQAQLEEKERVIIDGKTLVAYAGLPLLFQNECVGVLYIDYFEDHSFTENEKSLGQLFGLQAAVAIHNARQFELAERLVRAERWAELGKLAGGLAHRIGNKGGTIRLRAEELTIYLRSKLQVADEHAYQLIETITHNNQYILELAEILFKPFRAMEESLRRLDLKLLINSAIQYADIPKEVTVTVKHEAQLPPVAINRFFVEVFVEIISNAVEAMRGSASKALNIQSRYDAQWVILSFTDTGRGISTEELDNIFGLFSTTRPDTEEVAHHGFGLWWIRTFLRDIGNDITVDSQIGQGTTFTVYIKREDQ